MDQARQKAELASAAAHKPTELTPIENGATRAQSMTATGAAPFFSSVPSMEASSNSTSYVSQWQDLHAGCFFLHQFALSYQQHSATDLNVNGSARISRPQ